MYRGTAENFAQLLLIVLESFSCRYSTVFKLNMTRSLAIKWMLVRIVIDIEWRGFGWLAALYKFLVYYVIASSGSLNTNSFLIAPGKFQVLANI